jgi:hypothetical protein
MHATFDAVVGQLQECGEILLSMNFMMPRHATVEAAAMLAMVAYKTCNMHHTRAISCHQHEEYFGI